MSIEQIIARFAGVDTDAPSSQCTGHPVTETVSIAEPTMQSHTGRDATPTIPLPTVKYEDLVDAIKEIKKGFNKEVVSSAYNHYVINHGVPQRDEAEAREWFANGYVSAIKSIKATMMFMDDAT